MATTVAPRAPEFSIYSSRSQQAYNALKDGVSFGNNTR